MRALIQRVSEASVRIAGEVVGSIDAGLLVLLGVEHSDEPQDIEWLVNKIAALRIFNDEAGKMNYSLLDTGGQALVVSQFTLHASCKKGARPSYIRAARPEQAEPMYEAFVTALSQKLNKSIPTGRFGADMQLSLVNDGPVTIMLDSRATE